METIEAIFESYKASCNEETPHNEEQDTAMCELEKATLIHPENGQSAFDKAVALSRASEKAGFILGFKMAFNLMSECRGGGSNIWCSGRRFKRLLPYHTL